jgi:alpha-D-ribose 1-methylphosphonate 5-triphosphate diphosphatase PhnM
MNDVLNKSTVLVLNRNWQAIHVKTPAQAFCMMATDAATALDIQESGDMCPVKWADWLTLPVRDGDNCVRTVHCAVRKEHLAP